MIGNSDNETNLPHKLLLTNTQVMNLRKVFTNNSLVNIKLSKSQLSKLVQSEGFLGRLLGPLLKTGLPLKKKNVTKPLAKTILIPLAIPAATSASDAGIHKKPLGSGTATIMVSNKEMEDIMKLVRSLENSGLFLKEVSETIQNEAKEQKGGFLSMLLETLGTSCLGNMLESKGINGAGDGMIRAGYGSERSWIKKIF